MIEVTSSLAAHVGNTPLFEIPTLLGSHTRIFAKIEWVNPSGSVKDRAAASMVLDALQKGQLGNKILLDATSGNTGLAYGMLGAALRFPVELALPENASPERKALLYNYGVSVHFTSAMEGTDGAQRYVKSQLAQFPDRYFCPDQYNNPCNWLAHFEGTGPEIWAQTDAKVTHFIAGLGTSGTFMGTTRFLQPKGVKCISVQPETSLHGLEGWKHMETAIVPGIYDATLADHAITISTEAAFAYAKAAFRDLGLQLSPSSAANLAATIKVASENGPGFYCTVFPDNAMKYLNERFWKQDDYTLATPFRRY